MTMLRSTQCLFDCVRIIGIDVLRYPDVTAMTTDRLRRLRLLRELSLVPTHRLQHALQHSCLCRSLVS